MARNRPKASETANPTDRDYVANWRVDNVEGAVLDAGDVIALDPEVAQPLLAVGALSEVEAAPVADTEDEGSAE
jgi:hypothetical protein